MNSDEVAERFVQFFCNGDLPGLASLISEGLTFRGPFLECSSRSEYLASLSGNLEADPDFRIEAKFKKGNEAAVFYRYRGNSIAQLFLCRNGQVIETKVIFDSASMA